MFDRDIFSPNGVCVCVCACVCVRVCACVRVSIHTYTYMCVHTQYYSTCEHCVVLSQHSTAILSLSFVSSLDFLGCAKLPLSKLLSDGPGPWKKRILLEDVPKGEVEMEIELIG